MREVSRRDLCRPSDPLDLHFISFIFSSFHYVGLDHGHRLERGLWSESTWIELEVGAKYLETLDWLLYDKAPISLLVICGEWIIISALPVSSDSSSDQLGKWSSA